MSILELKIWQNIQKMKKKKRENCTETEKLKKESIFIGRKELTKPGERGIIAYYMD